MMGKLMRSILKSTALALLGATAISAVSYAKEGSVPHGGFGGFDHVFFIIMENKTDTDILGNSYAPFINAYAKVANRATNYFAVGHPSAPNYLEIVGGSNFGLTNDYWPNWPNGGCVDHAPGSTGCVNAFTPIAVAGADNPVVATATSSSQCNGEIAIPGTPAPNNCALYNYPAAYFTPKSDRPSARPERHELEKLSGGAAECFSRRLRAQLLGRRLLEPEPRRGFRTWRDPETLRRQTQPLRLFP